MIHHEGTEARKKLKPTDLLIAGENTELRKEMILIVIWNGAYVSKTLKVKSVTFEVT